MKLKHLFLILLALCLIGFLTGCDSGGGSSSSGGGGGGGDDSGTVIYKVTDLVDHTGVSNFNSNNGTISYTYGGYDNTATVTLTVNHDNKTYSLHEVETSTDPGVPDVGCTFSGTWEVSGNNINIHNTLTTYDNGDPDDTGTWDDTFTITGETTIQVWAWV
ncbi:MAG: hypothetical protein IJQ27_04085, partial [Spirochaetia bacterium]|nr:hypothetical protein [Spirochaetia bacterium]